MKGMLAERAFLFEEPAGFHQACAGKTVVGKKVEAVY
jgi:hypothetical protein